MNIITCNICKSIHECLDGYRPEADVLRAELEAERSIRSAIDEEFLKTGLGVPETKPETYAAHVAEIWQALEAAKRDNADLRIALKPFAEAEDVEDITPTDLRRAAKALEAK